MRGRLFKVLSIAVVMVMVFTAGCTGQKSEKPQDKVNEQLNIEAKVDVQGQGKKIVVFASIYPMYDFAKNIGKDKIELKQMVPTGAEPHDWEPTAKLMAELEKADVFIYNGAGMEPWVDKVKGAVTNPKLQAVEASFGIELLKQDYDEHDKEGGNHGEYDPHIWLDPIKAAEQAEIVKNALVKADEANKEFYEKNYKEYADKLSALDRRYQENLSNLKRKEIVVAHAAFGYLTDRYGLEQIAIKGITPEAEPSPAKLIELTKLLKSKGAKYIFFETLSNPKVSQVLAKEVGAETAVLNPVDGLTEEDVLKGKDYISVMEENLVALKKALGE